jgi:hypothetical protein
VAQTSSSTVVHRPAQGIVGKIISTVAGLMCIGFVAVVALIFVIRAATKSRR